MRGSSLDEGRGVEQEGKSGMRSSVEGGGEVIWRRGEKRKV
jgi:hypothetical protein